MRGSHCLGQWSRTQSCVALSSAEAELNASLKGACELMALQTLFAELGDSMSIEILGDSSACLGVLHREGVGRVKHLQLKQLWLQSHIKDGNVRYTKVPREANPSDTLTKNWGKDAYGHFRLVSFEVHGRMQSNPEELGACAPRFGLRGSSSAAAF